MKEKQVIDFLYNNKLNPFTKKTKLIIYLARENDEEIINNIVKDIYKNVYTINIKGYSVCFIMGKYDVDINNLFLTIGDDLGYEITLHSGIYVNEEMSAEDILEYINIYINTPKSICMDIADFVINTSEENHFKLIDIISRSNFTYIYKDIQTIDIVESLFKNNLNVLQTSKVLYLHRNSILNKIDIIYKETGLNIQKFTNAYLVKQILSRR